jgi:hypothetical protein
MTACKICSSSTTALGTATVLDRHEANFVRCAVCGFVSVVEPTWLDEAYGQPINETDIGLLDRNVTLAAQSARIIATCFDHTGEFLDFGGGYGVLVRLMRDRGFSFRLCDEYTANLFAGGLSVTEVEMGSYELITAFEVIEHLVDPARELHRLLEHSGSVLFSTELLPSPTPALTDWWYYGLEHGQHLSFFTREAFRRLAEHSGRRYLTDGHTLHLITDRPISERRFRLVAGSRLNPLVNRFAARRVVGRSLLQPDYQRMLASRDATDR